MSQDLFRRVRSLLQDHVRLLNQYSLGDIHVEEAEGIIDEINILLQSDEVKNIEHQIDEAERKLISEDLANEIINGKYCVGGNCED